MRCPSNEHVSVQELRDLLDLDVATGRLTWKARTCGADASAYQRASTVQFNARFAGREALACRTPKGYLMGSVKGKPMRAHRVVFALHHGRWPGEIDHINRVRDDNRPANLREVTSTENARNRAVSVRNSTGKCGVRKVRSGKWTAFIMADYQQVHLGVYESFEEACAARNAAECLLAYREHRGVSLPHLEAAA